MSRCTHRAHGARARKAREIREARETCQGSSCRRRRAARRQGGPPLARPERRACRLLYDHYAPFEPSKTRESCNPAAPGKPRGAGKSSFRVGPRDG